MLEPEDDATVVLGACGPSPEACGGDDDEAMDPIEVLEDVGGIPAVPLESIDVPLELPLSAPNPMRFSSISKTV